MKGCLKFFLGVILFFLLAAAAAGIYGIIWTERHLYAEQGMALEVPELDLPHQANLLKLFPLKGFLSSNSKLPQVKVKLNEKEANWLLNHYFLAKNSGARAELKFEENRVTGKYSRRINPQKYFNLMADASLNYHNCVVQVGIERLQVGDYLAPTTVLGELGYLAEYYLELNFCGAGDRGFLLSDLELKPDSVSALFVKP